MSEELQRLLGAMEAKIEALIEDIKDLKERRIGRLERAFITIGAGAIGLVAVVVLKQAGLM